MKTVDYLLHHFDGLHKFGDSLSLLRQFQPIISIPSLYRQIFRSLALTLIVSGIGGHTHRDGKAVNLSLLRQQASVIMDLMHSLHHSVANLMTTRWSQLQVFIIAIGQYVHSNLKAMFVEVFM